MTDDGWNNPRCGEIAQEHREQQGRNGFNGHDESEIVQLEINRLAKLSLLKYDLERTSATERLGIRASTLDRLVEAERKKSGQDGKQGQALSLPEPEPWPSPINGADLLANISAAIQRYVVMPNYAAEASALWVVHTYLIRCFDISPRLAITSPEKGCGKTTTIDVLSRLVWRPLPTANTTAAAIFGWSKSCSQRSSSMKPILFFPITRSCAVF